MTVRAAVGFGILAGGGILLYEYLTGNLANVVSPPVGSNVTTTTNAISDPNQASGSSSVTQGFLNLLASIESGGNPDAKNPNSSASGLFQFTKSTAQALGLPWGSDPSQPFGGANVSVDDQINAAQDLTNQNASILSKNGIDLTNSSLYAAHFLGPSTAVKVLSAPVTSSLSTLIGKNAMVANGFPSTWNVGNFMSWLTGKTGG